MADAGNRFHLNLRDLRDGRPAAELIGAATALVWLLMAGGFFLAVGTPAAGSGALIGLAVVLPVALIGLAVGLARATRQWRLEAARLQAELDALRQAQIAPNAPGARPAAEDRATPAAAPAAPRPEAAPSRPAALSPAPSDPQPSLALEPEAANRRAPLTAEEFVRALNFPDDDKDREGFRVLRRALEDLEAGRLVRASQDVLTLLSSDGIYMDDLRPDRARPEVWRRFAAGERGRAIAALGGVRDRSSLALAAARMREDVIFRDAAHHFLRNFDRTVSAFVDQASDQEIADLAETRTARAFMLLGRVAGTFD